MVWHRQGTVAVINNSATVTGTNAAFAANVRVGDSFQAPDGKSYEIINVASDTVISIAPVYAGSTASGQTYSIMPVQGYPKALMDAVGSVNQSWGAKLGALKTTGNYDVLPIEKGGTSRSDGRALLSEVGVNLSAALFSSNQGSFFGWNANGNGEANFVCNKGAGVGGFTWRSVNQNNTATGPSMSYSYDGLLSVTKISVSEGVPISSGGTGKTTADAALQALGGLKNGAGNSSIGTSLFSGAPPGIASISSSNNDGNTALRIGNGNNNNASSVITFIRDGSFGLHLGIDTDNKFKIGGFSMGAVARTIYNEGNAVGTVSQSSGIPTGAIIETGALNGGRYTKFADGTMICEGISPGQATANAAGGSVFYSGGVAFTFAAPFIAVPAVVIQALTTSGYFCWGAAEGAASTTGVTGRVVSPANGASSYLCYIAKGRWF